MFLGIWIYDSFILPRHKQHFLRADVLDEPWLGRVQDFIMLITYLDSLLSWMLVSYGYFLM